MKVTLLEMLLIYPLVIGAIFALYIWRKKVEIWVMVSFAMYIALIYGYAIPNLGSMVRYRYSSIMIIAALGFSAIVYLYYQYKLSKHKN